MQSNTNQRNSVKTRNTSHIVYIVIPILLKKQAVVFKKQNGNNYIIIYITLINNITIRNQNFGILDLDIYRNPRHLIFQIYPYR